MTAKLLALSAFIKKWLKPKPYWADDNERC